MFFDNFLPQYAYPQQQPSRYYSQRQQPDMYDDEDDDYYNGGYSYGYDPRTAQLMKERALAQRLEQERQLRLEQERRKAAILQAQQQQLLKEQQLQQERLRQHQLQQQRLQQQQAQLLQQQQNKPRKGDIPVQFTKRGKKYCILAHVPGIDSENIELKVKEGQLVIKATRFHTVAVGYRQYRRVAEPLKTVVPIPAGTSAAQVTAEMIDAQTLCIEMPKLKLPATRVPIVDNSNNINTTNANVDYATTTASKPQKSPQKQQQEEQKQQQKQQQQQQQPKQQQQQQRPQTPAKTKKSSPAYDPMMCVSDAKDFVPSITIITEDIPEQGRPYEENYIFSSQKPVNGAWTHTPSSSSSSSSY